VSDPVRLALGTFTAIRVRPPGHVDRSVVRGALLLTPLVGAALGVAGGVVLEATRQATHHSIAGVWLAAVLAVASVVVLSRGLHLDGLADTADGLGSGRGAESALAVMRRSDIGPFGVVTVVLVLLVQVAAVAESIDRHTGWLGILASVIAGRAAVVWGCRAGVPAARADGLGLPFAGALRIWVAVSVTALTAVACAGLSWLDEGRSGWLSARAGLAVVAAAFVGAALVARCVRRFGGVTGDVLGAVVELGTTAALLCFALV
jgi:adenosylcobinamide-GDP ribazoletransferase